MKLIATTLLAAAAFAASFALPASASAPRAAHFDCVSMDTILYPNPYGFRRFFLGVGTQWFHRATIWTAEPPATSSFCSYTQAFADLAGKTVNDVNRFYQLYHAFPLRPTAAQWRLRFHPLVAAAIVADTDMVALINKDAVDYAAAYNSQFHCGVPPNPPNLCDNEDLPETAAGRLAETGYDKGALVRFADDLAWLRSISHAPYGTKIQ